jgi:hypothetical protein
MEKAIGIDHTGGVGYISGLPSLEDLQNKNRDVNSLFHTK